MKRKETNLEVLEPPIIKWNEELEEKWLMDKWGCFGASDMFKLWSKGKGEMFGVGAKTLIKKVARQAYTTFNMEDNVETYSMRMGKILEPQSFGYVYNLLGLKELEYFGSINPIFIKHCKDCFNTDTGCSPDGAAKRKDGTISFGIELKNNKGDTHWDSLTEIKRQSDLKEKSKDDYTQCQFSMACCDADVWLWISYNEYFPDKHKALIVEVTPDKEFMEELEERITAAIKKKYEYIDEMKNRN